MAPLAERTEHITLTARIREHLFPPPTPDLERLDRIATSVPVDVAWLISRGLGASQQTQGNILGLAPVVSGLGRAAGAALAGRGNGTTVSFRDTAGRERTVTLPPAPPVRVPEWVQRVPLSATGVRWGRGTEEQGDPFENYRATQLPPGTRLPKDFERFDFRDSNTGRAESVKTLDTESESYRIDPARVYSTLKRNIDAIRTVPQRLRRSGATISPDEIRQRVLTVAVPSATTQLQWDEISRAVAYGQSVGVQVRVVMTE